MNLNFSDAKGFVEFLTGDSATPMNWRFIKGPGEVQKIEGSLGEVWPKIEKASAQGYNTFVVINEGGGKNEDITKVRALFVDADDKPLPKSWHVQPQVVTSRDDTHWHAYWEAPPDYPVEKFKEDQLALAHLYGTDPQVCNEARVMRVPGTLHLKDPTNPKQVKISYAFDAGGANTRAELMAGVPPAPRADRNVKRKDGGLPEAMACDWNVGVARAIAGTAPPAVQGQNGDDATIKLANHLMDYVSKDKAVELMVAHWLPRCSSEWDPTSAAEWIEAKAYSALQSRDNGVGCDAAFPPELGQDIADFVPPPAPALPKWKFYADDERDQIPKATFLVPGLIQTRAYTLISGPSGSYKSVFTHHLMLYLASGRSAWGIFPHHANGTCVYAALEGMSGLAHGRREAWGLEGGTMDKVPVYLTEAPLMRTQEQQDAFIAGLHELPQPIQVVALDTAAKVLSGLDEINGKDMSILTEFADRLAKEFACSTLIVAHTRKDGTPGARGNNRLQADAATRIDLSKPQQNILSVQVSHHKDAKTPNAPWLFRIKEVTVSDGESFVLVPMSKAEYQRDLHEHDPYKPTSIASALIRLGAMHGTEVTTERLSAEIVGRGEDDTVEQYEGNLRHSQTILKKRAAEDLQSYARKVVGRGILWALPYAAITAEGVPPGPAPEGEVGGPT